MKQIKKILGSVPSHITYVPIDFDTQTLDEALGSKGLDTAKTTFFIWEGVMQYIAAEAVDSTLKYISKTSPGSRIVFTYVLKSVIDGTSNLEDAASLMTKMVKTAKAPWIFGLEPINIKEFLRHYNLSLIEDIGASYYQENYLKPIGRDLKVSEVERITLAQVINGNH